MDRIFGGPVVPTLFKLALMSVMVGLVFHFIGIDPLDLWRDFGATIRQVWEMTLDAINWSWRYAALGAIVVLPVWIIYRLMLAMTKRPKG